MLEALGEAHGDRWSNTDELLRTLILRVDLLFRQYVVSHGGDEPEALKVLRPGEVAAKPKGHMRSTVMRALNGLRAG